MISFSLPPRQLPSLRHQCQMKFCYNVGCEATCIGHEAGVRERPMADRSQDWLAQAERDLEQARWSLQGSSTSGPVSYRNRRRRRRYRGFTNISTPRPGDTQLASCYQACRKPTRCCLICSTSPRAWIAFTYNLATQTRSMWDLPRITLRKKMRKKP